jgi:hypothetical protein
MGRSCDPTNPSTFGDGQTQFFFEARCPKFTSSPSQLCKGCREDQKNGRIDGLIPEGSQIFGPTTWFLDMVKRCGAPSREVFKKAVEAHKQVIGSMAPRKKVAAYLPPAPLSFIEIDECIEIKEIREIKLKHVKSTKKKQILKDEINGYLFDKLEGQLTLSSPPSLAKATSKERAVQEVH